MVLLCLCAPSSHVFCVSCIAYTWNLCPSSWAWQEKIWKRLFSLYNWNSSQLFNVICVFAVALTLNIDFLLLRQKIFCGCFPPTSHGDRDDFFQLPIFVLGGTHPLNLFLPQGESNVVKQSLSLNFYFILNPLLLAIFPFLGVFLPTVFILSSLSLFLKFLVGRVNIRKGKGSQKDTSSHLLCRDHLWVR